MSVDAKNLIFRGKQLPKHWLSIILAILMFVTLEMVLQVRSQMRYGSSIFNLINDQAIYVKNEELGLKFLRANTVIDGSQATIVTNSLGLRSPEVVMPKPADVLRFAVVGASSVMGTYTRNNDDTLSYKLQERFPHHFLGVSTTEFVNAGIAGYSLKDQQVMVESVLLPLGVDAIILYPGFNDLSSYCKSSSEAELENHSLYNMPLPKWLLSIELITKNTVALREVRAGGPKYLNASSLDTREYQAKLDLFFDALVQTGLPVLLLTNPRAYARDMPESEQRRLSQTARFYNPCFDVNGLHDLFDVHNDLLANTASDRGFDVFRLDREMPKGGENFGDATHFSVVGTDRAAALVAPELARYLARSLTAQPMQSDLTQ